MLIGVYADLQTQRGYSTGSNLPDNFMNGQEKAK